MTIKTLMVAVSLVLLSGCVNDIVGDDDDADSQQETSEQTGTTQQGLKTRH